MSRLDTQTSKARCRQLTVEGRVTLARDEQSLTDARSASSVAQHAVNCIAGARLDTEALAVLLNKLAAALQQERFHLPL
jgi:ribosomal protein L17